MGTAAKAIWCPLGQESCGPFAQGEAADRQLMSWLTGWASLIILHYCHDFVQQEENLNLI